MIKEVYKIVKCDCNNRYYSLLIQNIDFLKIEYKINEWAKPRIGKILAFDTQKNAEIFWQINENISYNSFLLTQSWLIFKAEAKNTKLIKRLMYLSSKFTDREYLFNTEKLIKFWSEEKNVIDETLIAPSGTLACDELKLIKEID